MAAINRLPMGDRELSIRVTIEGSPPVADDPLPFAALATISRDYLQTLRVPLLRGRAFDDADFERGPAVALVSQEAARRLWNGADPLGARIRLNGAAVRALRIFDGSLRNILKWKGAEPTHSAGHRRSASASPSVLTARTVAKMNTPGNNASHGSVLIVVCA